MVLEQKKTREPAEKSKSARHIAKGYRNKQKHATKRRKLASLIGGGA